MIIFILKKFAWSALIISYISPRKYLDGVEWKRHKLMINTPVLRFTTIQYTSVGQGIAVAITRALIQYKDVLPVKEFILWR